jgi:hypothetical protein
LVGVKRYALKLAHTANAGRKPGFWGASRRTSRRSAKAERMGGGMGRTRGRVPAAENG